LRKIILVLIAAVLTCCALNAGAQNGSGNGINRCNLRVIVDGFQSDRGFAKIGLCNSSESFQLAEEKAVISTTTRIAGGKAQYVFRGVPFGNYAVSVYHDENGNGKLDKGAFNKPLELYGFSNNARGVFGRPEYEKAAFVLDKTEMTINVTVR